RASLPAVRTSAASATATSTSATSTSSRVKPDTRTDSARIGTLQAQAAVERAGELPALAAVVGFEHQREWRELAGRKTRQLRRGWRVRLRRQHVAVARKDEAHGFVQHPRPQRIRGIVAQWLETLRSEVAEAQSASN